MMGELMVVVVAMAAVWCGVVRERAGVVQARARGSFAPLLGV